jgi:hypothetical protein
MTQKEVLNWLTPSSKLDKSQPTDGELPVG